MLTTTGAAPAAAALLEIDLETPGDRLVTRDTDSGLDWLDITVVPALTPAELLGGAGGWADAGWRLATTSEVCGFFGRASEYPITCPGVTYVSVPFGQPILDLMGFNATYDQQRSDGTTLHLEQIWAAFDDGTLSPWAGGVELSVDTYSNGTVRTYLSIRADYDPGFGVLLVRPIPEPSTALTIAFGLALLAGRARNLRSRCAGAGR